MARRMPMTGEDEILRCAQDDSVRSLRVMLRGDPDRQLHYQWHSPTKSFMGRGTRWKGTAGDHKGPPSRSPPPSPLQTDQHVSTIPSGFTTAVAPMIGQGLFLACRRRRARGLH